MPWASRYAACFPRQWWSWLSRLPYMRIWWWTLEHGDSNILRLIIFSEKVCHMRWSGHWDMLHDETHQVDDDWAFRCAWLGIGMYCVRSHTKFVLQRERERPDTYLSQPWRLHAVFLAWRCTQIESIPVHAYWSESGSLCSLPSWSSHLSSSGTPVSATAKIAGTAKSCPGLHHDDEVCLHSDLVEPGRRWSAVKDSMKGFWSSKSR
jgi:hypothetical protein